MHSDAASLITHAKDKRMNLPNIDTNNPTPLTETWDFSHLQRVDFVHRLTAIATWILHCLVLESAGAVS